MAMLVVGVVVVVVGVVGMRMGLQWLLLLLLDWRGAPL
jgi:hypothetical protein